MAAASSTASCKAQHATLTSLTPGVATILVDKPELVLGRDHAASPWPRTGITCMQVSREQVRVKRGLGGRLQLLNKGIGICRILSSGDESPATLHQGESRTLHPGDCIKLMKVVRSCECSVSRVCSCPGGRGDDRVVVAAEWRLDGGPHPPRRRTTDVAPHVPAADLANHLSNASKALNELQKTLEAQSVLDSSPRVSQHIDQIALYIAAAATAGQEVLREAARSEARCAHPTPGTASSAPAAAISVVALDGDTAPIKPSPRVTKPAVPPVIALDDDDDDDDDDEDGARARGVHSSLPFASRDAPVSPPCSSSAEWGADDPLEKTRREASEAKADAGWVQCDRCKKWRPPVHAIDDDDDSDDGRSSDSSGDADATAEDDEQSGGVKVGAVTGVVDDGEGEWYCEMHPDPMYASCDAAVVKVPLGSDYQVSHIPAYRGPACPDEDDGTTAKYLALRALTPEELGVGGSPSRHSPRRLSPRPQSSGKRRSASKPNAASARKNARRAQASCAMACSLLDLPADDSQRPENLCAAAESDGPCMSDSDGID